MKAELSSLVEGREDMQPIQAVSRVHISAGGGGGREPTKFSSRQEHITDNFWVLVFTNIHRQWT
jgi:hypothetical protein